MMHDRHQAARILRDRQAASDAIRSNAGPRRRSSGATRQLVQVFAETTLPTTGDTFFATHPVELDCPQSEGSPCSPVVDSGTTIYVNFLGNAPKAGDLAVATHVGGRWVARKGGQAKPVCRWMCGPYVQFDSPTGTGGTCAGATAAITVATDGTIADVKLISGGSCYEVANPAATVKVDGAGPGSGATLAATVGEVVTLTPVNSGLGYDPASPPSVTIANTNPGGTAATAHATVNASDGSLVLTLDTGGALYADAAPTVVIDPPPAGGVQATATATAKPGEVTSITLGAVGSAYLDNSPPLSLNLTIASPGWSVSLALAYNQYASGKTPPATTVDGTLPYCAWSGTTTVDLPATGAQPALSGVLINVAVYSSEYYGWVLTINFPTLSNSPTTIPCPGVCNTGGAEINLLETGGTGAAFEGDSPYGPNSPLTLRCTSRPYSATIPATVHSNVAGCATYAGTPWFVLGGGDCQGTTAVTFTFTLSEP